MYRRSRVNVKVKPRSTLTFTRGLPPPTHVQYTQTDKIRQTDSPLVPMHGSIGTNRKAHDSNGSIGEYASY